MKKGFVSSVLIGLFVSSPAWAASMAANVSSIFELNGQIYVGPSNVAWDGPATSCAPASPMYVVDPSTAAGRSQLALLLTAKAAGTRVYLVGNGTCVSGGPNGILSESLTGIQLM